MTKRVVFFLTWATQVRVAHSLRTPLHALMRRIVFAVRDERNSPMIHNRAPLARLLLLEGKSYEEISL